ncbi:MAG: glycine zipper 2TM domain-containing protein [Oligoflexia bacterium]|nr:glycine zipper 2TM domain-containing protein [Oligoflexia bacterium]
MNIKISAFLLLIFLFLGGCSTWDKLDRTERGAVIGGGTGALVGGAAGSTTGAVVGGAAGALAGGVIGHETEDRDYRRRR